MFFLFSFKLIIYTYILHIINENRGKGNKYF